METTGSAVQVQRSLVRKLSEVMGEVGRLRKTGHNNFHNYDYVTEADVVEAVRAGMAKRSLMMLPSVEKEEFSQIGNKGMRLCKLLVVFTIEDGDSGEVRTIRMVGEGTDQGDKASYKAMTGAEKYALLKTFMIATGDDPERDDPRPPAEHSAPPKPPNAAKPSPATQAAQAKVEQTSAVAEVAKALRARCNRLWHQAQAKGIDQGQFQQWPLNVLGHTKGSTDWSAEEVAKLEASLPTLLGEADETPAAAEIKASETPVTPAIPQAPPQETSKKRRSLPIKDVPMDELEREVFSLKKSIQAARTRKELQPLAGRVTALPEDKRGELNTLFEQRWKELPAEVSSS